MVTGSLTASFAIGPSGSHTTLGGGSHLLRGAATGSNLYHGSANTFTNEALTLHITGSGAEAISDFDWTLVMERI